MQMLKKNAKPLNQLKTIHTEHVNKLHHKHQQETELIEDLRSFCKQKAQLEKEYGQALLKLSATYLSKKDVMALSGSDEENRQKDGKSIWYVWRCLLEQTQAIAQARLRAVDTQQNLSDQLKPVKMVRLAANKRIIEQLKSLQSELAASLQEMVKAHKVYAEEEKQSLDARSKSKDAEDKLRRRSTNIFNSMAQLQKNSDKLSSRKDACETRSTTARNEYLFQLASVNAHLEHYFTIDLNDLAKQLDGEVFDKIQEVFTSVSRHELECCGLTQEHFSKVMCDAVMISREYSWSQFLKENPLFDEKIQYQFEPIDGDHISLLYPPTSKDDTLVNVAKKLVKRRVQREQQIKDYQIEMRAIQAGRVTPQQHRDYDSHGNPVNSDDMLAYNQEYVEHKVEELQHAIRREEIEKDKIQGCIHLLQQSGVDVTALLTEAYAAAAASLEAEPDNDSPFDSPKMSRRYPNQRYRHYGYNCHDLDAESLETGVFNDSESPYNDEGLNGSPQNQRQNIERQDTNEKSSLDSLNHESQTSLDKMTPESRSISGSIEETVTGVALYEFQASHPDEIDLVIDETVVILDVEVGEGWYKARSLIDGREGLIPSAFVVINRPGETGKESQGPPATTKEPEEIPNPPSKIRQESVESTGSAPKENMFLPVTPVHADVVRAMYDFVASNEDEISFPVGQLIRLLSTESSPGVDDGWWEGQIIQTSDETSSDSSLSSSARGFFPSMMVQHLSTDEMMQLNAGNLPLGPVPVPADGTGGEGVGVNGVQVMSPPDRPGPPAFEPPPIAPPLVLTPPTPDPVQSEEEEELQKTEREPGEGEEAKDETTDPESSVKPSDDSGAIEIEQKPEDPSSPPDTCNIEEKSDVKTIEAPTEDATAELATENPSEEVLTNSSSPEESTNRNESPPATEIIISNQTELSVETKEEDKVADM